MFYDGNGLLFRPVTEVPQMTTNRQQKYDKDSPGGPTYFS